MRYEDFQTELKRRITRESSSSDLDTHVKRWLNMSARWVSIRYSWKCLRLEDTISTVDGTEEYVLPIEFGKMGFCWHTILGYQMKLTPLLEKNYRGSASIGTTEGTPYWYRMFNSKGNVLAQPSSAGVVSVVSSDSGDTTQDIRVEGIVSSYPDAETINLNGTSAVTGSKSFSSIRRISKAASTTGRITVSIGGTTIGIIPAGDIMQVLRRKWIKFYYIPENTGDTINIYFYRKVFDAVNDDDSYPFDEEFDELILLRAQYIGLRDEEHVSVNRLDKLKKDIWEELSDLKHYDASINDDWAPVYKGLKPAPRLGRIIYQGAYYPAVRY